MKALEEEANLIFDVSSQLDNARIQTKKSLELHQWQMEKERSHSKQMDLGL